MAISLTSSGLNGLGSKAYEPSSPSKSDVTVTMSELSVSGVAVSNLPASHKVYDEASDEYITYYTYLKLPSSGSYIYFQCSSGTSSSVYVGTKSGGATMSTNNVRAACVIVRIS